MKNTVTTNPENEIVVIGCVGTSYGLHGWVKVHSYTQPSTNIVDYQPWLLQINQLWQPIEPVEYNLHDKQVVVKLPNCHTPEEAKAYTHVLIGVYRKQLPTLEGKKQYYWHDLIGLKVYTAQGEYLGLVDQLMATGSNDVLVVKGQTKHLIPFILEHFILDVDLNEKKIVVDWEAHE